LITWMPSLRVGTNWGSSVIVMFPEKPALLF